MRSRILCSLAICFLSFSNAVVARWSSDRFPNPQTNPDACGRNGKPRSFICDPDALLSVKSKDVIEGILNSISESAAPYAKSPCSNEGFQLAVATMKSMTIPRGVTPSDAAASFARSLHNTWGVGHGSCNDGALFFLSLDDRQMFVSTGDVSGRLLTDAVLDGIFAQIKPMLREGAYEAAVERAVVQIGQALAGNPIQKEKESFDYLGLTIFASFLALVPITLILNFRQMAARKLAFKSCKQRLDEIKRLSEALQQSEGAAAAPYNPQTCPICFEDFEPVPPTKMTPLADKEKDPEPSAPPLEESPLEEPTGDKEPLLRSPSSPSAPADPPSIDPKAAETKEKSKKPLILPCQHQFCENCVEAWVKQQKTSCPVCRKPMDGKPDAPPPPPPAPPPPPVSGPRGQLHQHLHHPSLYSHGAWMRARQREDLLYRIDQVRARYPAYVSESMAARARDDISQGRQVSPSVYTDLQLNDPMTRQALASSGSRGSSVSFGGGRSSGGRGSSW